MLSVVRALCVPVVILLALSLVACGARMQAEDERTGEPSSEAATDPAASAAAVPACPATYDAARALAVDCERAPREGCTYAEGACACEIHHRCSGVPPGPGEPNSWRTWTCREPVPAVRPNGCPGPEPAHGDPCDGRAPYCTYGECAFTPYRCVGGHWEQGMPSAPPSAPP